MARIFKRWRPVMSALALLMLAAQAQAACTWDRKPSETLTVTLPATLIMKKAAIGGVLARVRQDMGTYTFSCNYMDINWLRINTAGLTPVPGFDHVYESGVAGVGIRFGFGTQYFSYPLYYTDFEDLYALPAGSVGSMPGNRVFIDFIRTARGVGSGTARTPLSATYTMVGGSQAPRIIKFAASAPTVELENSIYFTGCAADTPTHEVPLGTAMTTQIAEGRAPWRDFSFELRCLGLRPAQPLPVKVYFEGTLSSGLVKLQDAGQSGVAKGVGIAVTDRNGNALPFTKAAAIPLEWQRSERGEDPAEVYLLSGRARYAKASGTVVAGRADGVITYVLEYN